MDSTHIHVRETDKERLETAKKDLFGTTDVPYRTVINHLLDGHDGVEV